MQGLPSLRYLQLHLLVLHLKPLDLLSSLSKLILNLRYFLAHSLRVDLVMLSLCTHCLLQSDYCRIKFLPLLVLLLFLLAHLCPPTLYLPLVGLKALAYLLDVAKVAVLGLKHHAVFLGFSPPKSILALTKHSLQQCFVLVVQGFDLCQALVVV